MEIIWGSSMDAGWVAVLIGWLGMASLANTVAFGQISEGGK